MGGGLLGAEAGIARDVGEDAAVPRAAEAAHAVADIQEERLTLLLAVIADVDAGPDLLRHHPVETLLAEFG